MKNIHSIYKFEKFQHDWVTFEQKNFCWGPTGPKMKILKKKKYCYQIFTLFVIVASAS